MSAVLRVLDRHRQVIGVAALCVIGWDHWRCRRRLRHVSRETEASRA